MRVLFICENYLPHYGGAEVVFKNLAERFVEKNHKVSLLTHQLKNTKKKEMMGGVEVYRVPSFHSRYIFSFLAISQAVRMAKKSDIIQTTTFNGAFPAWVAGKITGKPVVITVHEVWAGKWKKVTNFSWFKCFVHNLLERMIYLLPFDRYICVSQATKKDLLKLNIKREKVDYIYNGVDYDFWNPEKVNQKEVSAIKKKLELTEKYTYFSWGRPGPSKGFEYFIKAIPLIKKEKSNPKFIFMWGSPEKYPQKYKELISLIKKLKLQNDVKIIPPAPYHELRNYIAAVDCAVVPSIAEGFGYNVVEAAALKKKVVASNAGSIPEVISGKFRMFKNKDVPDLAEKAIAVSNNDYLETKQKIFLWDESIKKYLDTYNALLFRKKKKRK
jgi:glycosyltransferase involved in cell wall biosynthesis